ncbi:MAG TPA: DUF333 domain-containing protein [Candidatus Absconditabacterales bacterium]|nr:DUF333 domain-containing protein [Candidatus Absconditabacterales bacterium]
MKTKLLILIISISTLILAGCTTKNNNSNLTGNVELGNPASIYCEENGGTLEMIFDNGESYGICHFDNGERCEEREYYRGDCFPISNKTGKENTDIDIVDFISCVQAGNVVMESYPRQCKTQDGKIFTEKIDENLNENEENIEKNTEQTGNMVVCTMDAKECPDGSFVSRTGPNCEFEPCPGEKEKTEVNTQEDTKETNNEPKETIENLDNKGETLSQILEEYKNKESDNSESLTEDHIDLMEKLIEKLK